jgi:hypothetical protein
MFGSTSNTGLGTIVSLTTQIDALQKSLAMTTDPSAKAFIQAQIAVYTAQLSAEAQHQQTQADASANLLNGLGLFATLTGVVGNQAPSIINLFKIGH